MCEDYFVFFVEDIECDIFYDFEFIGRYNVVLGIKVLLFSECDEYFYLDLVFWGYVFGWWDKLLLINVCVEIVVISCMFKLFW